MFTGNVQDKLFNNTELTWTEIIYYGANIVTDISHIQRNSATHNVISLIYNFHLILFSNTFVYVENRWQANI